jgi:hypothetical protein
LHDRIADNTVLCVCGSFSARCAAESGGGRDDRSQALDLGALGVGDRVLCTEWRAWLIGVAIFLAATAFLFVIAFVMLGVAIAPSA